MRNERRRRDANRRTWGLIAATGLCSALLTLATAWALRALAQQPSPAPGTASEPPTAPAADDTAGPEGDALPGDGERRAAAPPAAEEPPDLRESADNNLSFPVDI
jgi:hypothetical protein